MATASSVTAEMKDLNGTMTTLSGLTARKAMPAKNYFFYANRRIFVRFRNPRPNLPVKDIFHEVDKAIPHRPLLGL